MKNLKRNAKAWVALIGGYTSQYGADQFAVKNALAMDLSPDIRLGGSFLLGVVVTAFLVWYIPNRED